MPLTFESGIARDFFRYPTGPGSYEWWYFDAYDDERKLGLVVIFFIGIPFSGARQRATRRALHNAGSDDPASFPAVAFSLYGPEKTDAYFVNLYEPGSFAAWRSPLSCAVAANSAVYRDGRYELEIEDELLSGGRVRASFTFEPMRVESPAPDSNALPSPHHWILAAPRCRVRGRVEYGQAATEFEGSGYHDHNVGATSLQHQFAEWEWGRALFRDRAVIYYRARGHDDAISSYLVRAGETVTTEPCTITPRDERRNIYRLRYPAALDIATTSEHLVAQQNRIVDNGPFYLRFLSSFRDAAGEEVTGFSEILRPRALSWSWFWPLLDSRVRPHGSRDVLGRKITQWLMRKGF